MVRTVIIQPPKDDEFKKYCTSLDADIMFRYLLFNVIDKYYRDMINNHNPALYEMYRGRLLGIEEMKAKIHEMAYSGKVSAEIESVLGALV
jgi:hypothetical protein